MLSHYSDYGLPLFFFEAGLGYGEYKYQTCSWSRRMLERTTKERQVVAYPWETGFSRVGYIFVQD